MKEKSYMVAIPSDEKEVKSLLQILNNLAQARWFEVQSSTLENDTLKLCILYHEESYDVKIYPMSFEIPELYRISHFFPDVDVEAIEQIDIGIGVEMEFGSDPLDSYHLQLRIIDAILPKKLAILDDSSEKVLSGRWAALAANSEIPPAPRYLYTVQAVSNEEDCVWLHSHGLNRCGLTELEILNSTKEMYQTHYSVIETLANRMMEQEEPFQPSEPIFLARLTEEVSLNVTFIDWKDAVTFYDEDMLGGKREREENNSHNRNTSVIFTYRSQEALENGQYSPVSIYDSFLKDNPIYMITLNETARMKALAAERISYLYQALKHKENHILVKLGLTIDEEFRTEDNSKEHIWFEVLDLKEDRITAKLTQEPYYIANLHENDIGIYNCDQITDWILFTPERRLTPDDVYLMELNY